MPAEQESDVDFRIAARGGAASNQPAAGRETLDALRPSGLADMLEYYIDAALFGEFFHFDRNVLLVMIDHVIGAQRLGFRQFGFPARGRDHPAVEQFGKL